MSLSPRTVMEYWRSEFSPHPPGDAAWALARQAAKLTSGMTPYQLEAVARVVQCAMTAVDEEWAKRNARQWGGDR